MKKRIWLLWKSGDTICGCVLLHVGTYTCAVKKFPLCDTVCVVFIWQFNQFQSVQVYADTCDYIFQGAHSHSHVKHWNVTGCPHIIGHQYGDGCIAQPLFEVLHLWFPPQEQFWLGSSPRLHSCRTTGKPQHLSGARKSAFSTFSAQGPVARSSTSFAESASTSLFQTFVCCTISCWISLIMASFWHLPFRPKQRAEVQDMFVTSRASSHVAQD